MENRKNAEVTNMALKKHKGTLQLIKPRLNTALTNPISYTSSAK